VTTRGSPSYVLNLTTLVNIQCNVAGRPAKHVGVTIASVLASRRMVRSFDGTAVDPDLLVELCATALWSPTAGNSAGVRMHVVAQSALDGYFAVATDADWRDRSERFAGLARAGAAVLVTSLPQAYESRYSDADKAASGLGDRNAWPIPYWHTDAAMATMSLLLLLEEIGLAATLWGNFRNDEQIAAWAGIENQALFGTLLIGRGDGLDHRSTSLERAVTPRRERVRFVTPNQPATFA